MAGMNSRSTRRAFFASGGAVLGASVATTVGASGLNDASTAPTSDEELKQLRRQLERAQARDAIRELHRAFTAAIENQNYEAATELFDERAHLDLSGVKAAGKPAIERLLTNRYRDQNVAILHGAYRQLSTSLQRDFVALSDDRLQAHGTFPVDVELCTPLQTDCTVAQMARLQGHFADRRWESGRFQGRYVRTRGEWKIASLIYAAV